jgi:hypothetical protein
MFAESDLLGLRALAQQELSSGLCSSKLAEVLEKILKAELIKPPSAVGSGGFPPQTGQAAGRGHWLTPKGDHASVGRGGGGCRPPQKGSLFPPSAS